MTNWHEEVQIRAVAFAEGKTSAHPLVTAIRMAMRAGCGDNSCQFSKPNGMGTNGGCRCWHVVESALFAVMKVAQVWPQEQP